MMGAMNLAQRAHSSAFRSRRASASRPAAAPSPARRPSSLIVASASSSATSTTPTTTTDGLIFAVGDPGAWDSAAVGNPVVRCYLSPPPLPPRGASAAELAAAARQPPVTRWVMWYSGRARGDAPLHPALAAANPGSGSTGIAYSEDGVTWRRGQGDVAGSRGAEGRADAGRALAPNADEWWWHDTCHATVSDVQVLGGAGGGGGGGVYWMFYSGGDFEAVAAPGALEALSPAASLSSFSARDDDSSAAAAEGLRMRVGLAMSQDGRNFARIEGDHHTGALLDAGGGGLAGKRQAEGASASPPSSSSSAAPWDGLYVSSPSVLVSGPSGEMRMYYTSFDAARNRFAVGLATSKDGLRWQRFAPSPSSSSGAAAAAAAAAPVFEGTGQPWDEAGAASVQVVRDPDDPRGRYLMFYEAVSADGARSIGAVASADGLSGWAPIVGGGGPLLAPAAAAAGEAAAAGAWDGGSVGAPCAVPMSGGKWRLYYAGRPAASGGENEDDDGAWRGVGLALGDLSSGAPFRRRVGV